MPSGACSCKVVDGNEIAASWPRNSLITVLCKGPAASRKGRGARSAANPSFSFIYAPNSQKVKELEAYFCLCFDYLLQPFRCQIFYVNRKYPDAYRMHSGWPFSLHTPFPDLWGFEPRIDYQSLPGQKSGLFTDVYKSNISPLSF